ncbi:MAG TPA: carbohydrate ABC transporter permease [Chloroflexota bacterium]|jgi:multiple sugar transport system permease protein|nr:carbohydrate ABC transporter permease [Chloroflexota bacterium]
MSSISVADSGSPALAALRLGLKVGVYAVLIVWAAISLLPIYWMLTTSVKAATTMLTVPPQWIPYPLSFEHYATIFGVSGLPRWIFNTAFVSVAVTAGNVLVNSMAAYAFAKLRFPGNQLLFWFLLSMITVPFAVVWVPLFILISNLKLLNTYWVLIVPGLASVWNIFLLKQFMQTLPSSLIDCARIDACSEFGIFWKIILPLAKPGLAVTAIFTFIYQWNSFFWWLLFTNTRDMRNLSVGLAQYRYEHTIDYGPLMAGASLSAIPVIVVFLVFQRYFLRGLTIGALKG